MAALLERGAELCAAGQSYLEQSPVAHELLLALQAQARGSKLRPWWVLRDGGQILGLLLFRPPFGAVFSEMSPDAAQRLGAELQPFLSGLSSLHAPASLQGVIRSTLGLSEPGQTMELQILKTLHMPEAVAGRFDRALPQDRAELQSWGLALSLDKAWSYAPERLDEWISKGRVYLWRCPKQRPVAMAIHNRSASWGACIGMIDSAPAHRGKGFARSVTAHTAQALLAAGHASVFLQVDPTRSGLRASYRALGFEPAHQTVSWIQA